MRTPTLLVASAILALLALAPTVAAEDAAYACHTWELTVGDAQTGAAASTDDAALLVAAEGYYIVSDGTILTSSYLFSVWAYQESNGQAGLQRGDEACDDTNGGETESDTFCFC